MLKLCDKSIITPLSILFLNCIDTRTFPDTWKKSNYEENNLYFVLISPGSELLILVNINISQYCIKFINLLIVIHQMMSGLFSQIFQKHLTECGMMGLSMKLNILASQATLSNRFQRVALNGQSSSWTPVCAGVPQGNPFLSYLYK